MNSFCLQIRIAAIVLMAAGTGLATKPVAHGVLRQVSTARAKSTWEKWKRTQAGNAGPASTQPGDPVSWLRIPSCKISTLVLRESHPEALHRFPAGRLLATGGYVVYAHRDLHFHALEKISLGDRIAIEGANGTSAIYRVNEIQILLPEEVAAALDDQQGGESLHLLTCYPFRYIGPAPKRFLVSATKSKLGNGGGRGRY